MGRDDTCGSQSGATQSTGTAEEANYLTSEVEDAFNQLGVPVREGSKVAVDAIFDSVSVSTTYRGDLAKHGIIFARSVKLFKNTQNSSKNI